MFTTVAVCSLFLRSGLGIQCVCLYTGKSHVLKITSAFSLGLSKKGLTYVVCILNLSTGNLLHASYGLGGPVLVRHMATKF